MLGMAFKDKFGELITKFRTVQTRVQPYFSNLLPEGRLRSYLAANVGVKEIREFFLLWALGYDLPGAVTVKSVGGRRHGYQILIILEKFLTLDTLTYYDFRSRVFN